jgi:uncharacterized integral membrane protein
MGAHDSEFEKAKTRLNSLQEDPGNDVKLRIYALFKQVIIAILIIIYGVFNDDTVYFKG